MKYNINKKNISIICFISWLILLGSINVYPINLFQVKSLLDFIHTTRIILPLIFGIILLVLLFKNLNIKTDLKKLNIYLILFFLLFTLELIGVFFNDRLNFQTIYLLIFGYISILLIFIIEKFKLQKIYKLLMLGTIIYILIAVIFLFYLKINSFQLTNFTGNFYSVFHPDLDLFKQAPPRATGYSRLVAVISLFTIIYIEYFKNKLLKILLIFFNTILAIVIWQFQSRGTFVCYYSSIFIILFLIENQNLWRNKISKLFLYFFMPILISSLAGTYQKNNLEINSKVTEINSKNTQEQEKIIDEVLIPSLKMAKDEVLISSLKIAKEEIYNNRLFKKNTSGRITLWAESIEFFDKKKFFGYGVQGDRVLIIEINNKKNKGFNPYGNNVSNGLIYSFVSGGYLALIVFIIIYVVTLKVGIDFFKKLLTKEKIEPSVQYSSILIFYLTIRTIFENGYALFSIDFLLFIIAISIMYDYLRKKENNENFTDHSMLK